MFCLIAFEMGKSIFYGTNICEYHFQKEIIVIDIINDTTRSVFFFTMRFLVKMNILPEPRHVIGFTDTDRILYLKG